jgi:GDP-L-fucose synthase
VNSSDKIYVAGNGLVGRAIHRKLSSLGYKNLITKPRRDLDLRDQAQTRKFFDQEQPDYVFLAAAKVGGIQANIDAPAEFLYDNLMIQSNVMSAADRVGVKQLLFLGSSCIYPKLCPQPIKEEYLLTGSLEASNASYAVAKIAGVKMAQSLGYLSAMPTNLYGPYDNFHPTQSHVIPGMMRRFHDARLTERDVVTLWGTGLALREFLHVDDLAEALVLMMNDYRSVEPVNIGSGEEITTRALAEVMRRVTGYQGAIEFDASRPDGTPRKLLDSGRMRRLGWAPRVTLREGLLSVYRWLTLTQVGWTAD